MKDTFFFARQRSGTTVLSHLLSNNGLMTPPECMTARKAGRPREALTYRFVNFCDLNNIGASQIIEDPESVLDQYLAYLKNFYDVENIALTAKTNQLYILPGSSYIDPYRPALVRYSFSRNLNVVFMSRRNLFRQFLSLAFAKETGIFHQPVDKTRKMGRRPDAVPLGRKKITLDADAAHAAMNDALKIGDLVKSWYANHRSFHEIVYEDIFDTETGGLTRYGANKIEEAFDITVTNPELELHKLNYEYRDHISNIDEVLCRFRGTKFEDDVLEVLGSHDISAHRCSTNESSTNERSPDRSPRHEKYFACIGAAKAGTSWLRSYIRHNTTADMPVIKEFHWFDEQTGKTSGNHAKAVARWKKHENQLRETSGIIQRHQKQFRDRANFKSDDDYRAFFETHCKPNSVFGDFTPAYSRLDQDGFERIKNKFPQAKFIFLMRNPADRHWSSLNMRAQLKTDFNPVEQFENSLVLEAKIRMGDYRQTFANAIAALGHDRVLTVFHEDLFGSSQYEILSEICAFLEIEGKEIKEETLRDNRRHYAPMPPNLRKRAVETFARTYQWALSEFGRVPDNWLNDMTTHNFASEMTNSAST